MIGDLQLIKEDFQARIGKRDLLRKQLAQEKEKVKQLTARLGYGEKARLVIQQVAQDTQKNLEYRISNLTTTALHSVSPYWPEFVAVFTPRRGKTECDLSFKEYDVLEKPIDSAGGGPLDVGSFSLKITYWNLNPNRPTFILDEPFKFVSPGLQHKISDMLKMLSDKLGLQIIMVSHAEEVNYSADKTFLVNKVDKISKVKEE